jgi:hypothetical protein
MLDYEIVFNDGEWQLWTPDTTGAILGTGKTDTEAKEDAIRSMEATCEKLMGMKSKPR